MVFKAGETAARSNYVISSDANIVGDWWSQHLNDSDDLDTSAVELDNISSDIIALALVSLDFKYTNLSVLSKVQASQYEYWMRRGGKPPKWWKQLLLYDVVEFCCLTEKTAVPGSVLSNHCWINQLPTWILEHLEDCLPRPNPRWLLQHTALLPRFQPVDTLILMPPVFLQGLLKGDRSFS